MSATLKKAQQNAKAETGKIGAYFDRMGAKMQKTGKMMSRNVTLPILAAGAAMVGLANRQAEAEAKLQSSFDSMGAAAWTNTEALKANAAAIQSISTFGDEAVIDMQAVLLTFGDVTNKVGEGNAVFDRATMAIVDLSAKMGQDLQQSAVMVGKALNDPIAGLSAMRRVGIQFTKSQEDQIKAMVAAGDQMGAQKVILAELERQFGGTAEAMAGTDAGKMKQAMNDLGDAGEQLGAVLTPIIAAVASAVAGMAKALGSLPDPAKKAVLGVLGLLAVTGPLLLVVGKLGVAFSAGGSLITGLALVKKAWVALRLAMMANPFMAIAAGVIIAAVIIYKNWDKITAFLKRTWDWIKKAASAVGDWIAGVFGRGAAATEELGVAASNMAARWRRAGEVAFSQHQKRVYGEFADGMRTLSDSTEDAGRAAADSSVVWTRYGENMRRVMERVRESAGKAAGEIVDLFADVPKRVTDSLSTIEKRLGEKEALGDTFYTNLAVLAAAGMDNLAGALMEGGLGVTDTVAELADNMELAWEWERRLDRAAASGKAYALAVATGIRDPAALKAMFYAMLDLLTAGEAAFLAYKFPTGSLGGMFSNPGSTFTPPKVPDPRGILPGGSFDDGGVVGGPRGAPRLIVAHGGETVVPTHKTGAGNTFNATINVTSSDPATIVRGLERELRRMAEQVV